MKTEMNFSLSPISSELSGAEQSYQATPQLNGVVSEEDTYKLTEQRIGVPSETVRMTVVAHGNVVKEQLRNGKQVTTSDIIYKPVMPGAYPTVDADFDPKANKLEARAITRNGLRNCFEGVVPKNLVSKPAPQLNQVGDAVTGKVGVLTIDNPVYLAGRDILPDKTQPDERVWLAKPDGTEAAVGTIGEATRQTVNVTFAAWPVAGDYILYLATRAGLGKAYTLVTVKKAVTVVPPENPPEDTPENPAE